MPSLAIPDFSLQDVEQILQQQDALLGGGSLADKLAALQKLYGVVNAVRTFVSVKGAWSDPAVLKQKLAALVAIGEAADVFIDAPQFTDVVNWLKTLDETSVANIATLFGLAGQFGPIISAVLGFLKRGNATTSNPAPPSQPGGGFSFPS